MINIGCITLRLIVKEDTVTIEEYTDVGNVLSVDRDTVIIDVNGEMYEFYGSDLSIGQRLVVRLDDNGTIDKKDDKVIDVVLKE